jgi:enoyl-CoA hydratase/carnithine racemase
MDAVWRSGWRSWFKSLRRQDISELSTARHSDFFSFEEMGDAFLLRLRSLDGTNRLTRDCVVALQSVIEQIRRKARPLVIAGADKFFSAGAELKEIAALDGPSAYEFSKMGQALMRSIEEFPAPVFAAVSGYCMGGGLDLALACHRRIAAPNAVFGHRGASLGLLTGWGGTQRLPRLVGKATALKMFVAAEKIDAPHALAMGLVDAIADDSVVESMRRIEMLLR